MGLVQFSARHPKGSDASRKGPDVHKWQDGKMRIGLRTFVGRLLRTRQHVFRLSEPEEETVRLRSEMSLRTRFLVFATPQYKCQHLLLVGSQFPAGLPDSVCANMLASFSCFLRGRTRPVDFFCPYLSGKVQVHSHLSSKASHIGPTLGEFTQGQSFARFSFDYRLSLSHRAMRSLSRQAQPGDGWGSDASQTSETCMAMGSRKKSFYGEC